jgi:WD40 repeat protein
MSKDMVVYVQMQHWTSEMGALNGFRRNHVIISFLTDQLHLSLHSTPMQQLLSKCPAVSLLTHADPFAQKYPDAVDATLPTSASCARFNPSGPFAGHYLATGELDGLVQVWDVETRGIARVLEGHVRAVSSIRCAAEIEPR